jgi:hypothetical protein
MIWYGIAVKNSFICSRPEKKWKCNFFPYYVLKKVAMIFLGSKIDDVFKQSWKLVVSSQKPAMPYSAGKKIPTQKGLSRIQVM